MREFASGVRFPRGDIARFRMIIIFEILVVFHVLILRHLACVCQTLYPCPSPMHEIVSIYASHHYIVHTIVIHNMFTRSCAQQESSAHPFLSASLNIQHTLNRARSNAIKFEHKKIESQRILVIIERKEQKTEHMSPHRFRLLECGESLAALEYFGVRQFIAALKYFGLRYVPVPLSFRDTSRAAFGLQPRALSSVHV